MKKAYNNQGALIDIDDITPTRNVGGIRFLLTEKEEQIHLERIVAGNADAMLRRDRTEIEYLERQVTPRRLRDAIISDEGKAWLATQEALIDIERKKLKNKLK